MHYIITLKKKKSGRNVVGRCADEKSLARFLLHIDSVKYFVQRIEVVQGIAKDDFKRFCKRYEEGFEHGSRIHKNAERKVRNHNA